MTAWEWISRHTLVVCLVVTMAVVGAGSAGLWTITARQDRQRECVEQWARRVDAMLRTVPTGDRAGFDRALAQYLEAGPMDCR